MQSKVLTAITKHRELLHLRVAWLCGVVLFLEGYDIAAAGYAIPSLVDAWRMAPSEFTQALTAGNVGLLIGSIGAGLLGDRVGRSHAELLRHNVRYVLPALGPCQLTGSVGGRAVSNWIGSRRRDSARDRTRL